MRVAELLTIRELLAIRDWAGHELETMGGGVAIVPGAINGPAYNGGIGRQRDGDAMCSPSCGWAGRELEGMDG